MTKQMNSGKASGKRGTIMRRSKRSGAIGPLRSAVLNHNLYEMVHVFTEDELRDELKAAFEAAREKETWLNDEGDGLATFHKWGFAAWYEQYLKARG